jgi:hypothetical protein
VLRGFKHPNTPVAVDLTELQPPQWRHFAHCRAAQCGGGVAKLALSARNYRHAAGLPGNIDRKKKWLKMATLVFQDRVDNGKDARERRAKDLPDIPADDEEFGGEDATQLGAAFYEQLLF